jgi:hypothetical protein
MERRNGYDIKMPSLCLYLCPPQLNLWTNWLFFTKFGMNVNDNPNVAVLNILQLVIKTWQARELKIIINYIIIVCQKNVEGQIDKPLNALLYSCQYFRRQEVSRKVKET